MAARVEGDRILALYERVFSHRDFTGRSGSFFAYEGLGSIYWHMVSKLLLAVQEATLEAVRSGEPAVSVWALAARYHDIRSGLGYCKTPREYGAFPTDPYSHTPAGSGARQPGMTGQVKEEILTRLVELGLDVRNGEILVEPALLRDQEWLSAPRRFSYRNVSGKEAVMELPAQALGFTFCQVPVVVRRGTASRIEALLDNGSVATSANGRLPADLSAEIFRRTGRVRLLRVTV